MPLTNPSWNEVLYKAAIVIEETSGTGFEPHHLAENNRLEAAARLDHAGMRLWRDVWVYLMAKKHLLKEPSVRAVA